MTTAARRSERRVAATKRQVMGVLDEENVDNVASAKHTTAKGIEKFIKNDLDISNPTHVRLLFDDIDTHLKQQQEIITADTATAKQEVHDLLFTGMMKLTGKTKKMTIREFNQKYDCDLIQIMKNVMKNKGGDAGKKKRNNNMGLETPAPSKGQPAPGSVRTVRRGEKLVSANGSPVEQVEEGALVATVTKKRRGKAPPVAIDINVGEGRVINIADRSTIQYLDQSMRSTAMNQIRELQDQMNSIMSLLGPDSGANNNS